MKQQSKLSIEQLQEHEAVHNLSKGPALEFKNAEELLRHDAGQIVTPPSLAERLQQTIASQPPRRSWWRRLLG